MEMSFVKHLLEKGKFLSRGAESTLYKVNFMGHNAILKYRNKKLYRIEELDKKIRRKRTYTETNLLFEASKHGLNVPKVLYSNIKENTIIIEYIKGNLFREMLIHKILNEIEIREISRKIGEMIGTLHNIDIVHGDLTTANIIVSKKNGVLEPYLIDFGLGETKKDNEAKAEDIDIFYRVLDSTHPKEKDIIFGSFIDSYTKNIEDSSDIIRRFKRIRRMGRYVEKRKRRY
jgi:Kae1-associated kinase Bud32